MKYIITLTSYGHRLKKTASHAIASLLNQSVKSDKLFLWLAHNTPIPPVLKKFYSKGLEIKFCDDLKSYKKLIPALSQFPDDVLITADDDVLYPSNWLEQLKRAYIKDPSKIHVHRAHQILFDEKDQMMPYKNWIHCNRKIYNEAAIFATGSGGILYPPNSLHKSCRDKKTFMSVAPTGDDIWFWAMARLNATKISIVRNGYVNLKSIDSSDKGLWENNIGKGLNDVQLQSTLQKFPILKTYLEKQIRGSIKQEIPSDKPLISVIIPCYNVEKFVGRSVKSILSQTFKNFEYIIVNNGSTDNSDKEIRNYLTDKRIVYHCLNEKKETGVVRNIGLQMAKGKFIAIMDAHSIADVNRLLIQYEFLEMNKTVGCVGSWGYLINDHDEIIENLIYPLNNKVIKTSLLRDNCTLHTSLIFRAVLLKKHSVYYNENLSHSADYDLMVRAAHLFSITNMPHRLIKCRKYEMLSEPSESADPIRSAQLSRFGISFLESEIVIYQKAMNGTPLCSRELEKCLEIFNKILEQNKLKKTFFQKQLFGLFKEVLHDASIITRRNLF